MNRLWCYHRSRFIADGVGYGSSQLESTVTETDEYKTHVVVGRICALTEGADGCAAVLEGLEAEARLRLLFVRALDRLPLNN